MNLTVESAKGRHAIHLSSADQPLRLSELLRRRHLPLNTRCGQRGLCDGCLVEINGTTVRSCELKVNELTTDRLRIPARSLLAHRPQVVSEFKLKVPRAHDPLGGETNGLGVAVDIGTTTVALLLCDLRDGRVLAGAADFNKQIHLGDDVLTRINLCSTDTTQVRHLQELIVKETITPLLHEALGKAGATLAQVRCMTIAGNTTMLHLFAGVDPSSMGIAPFTPTFLEHRIVSDVFPFAVHLMPGAAAYVGADLTAGALATGLIYDDGPSLLVDVGTNGEIILKRGEHLWGCATAAGPAFEGAGLAHGVRATDGAIAHIEFEGRAIKFEKIGTAAPIGLCGTAYVDFLAAGRAAGFLSATGRFATGAEICVTPQVTITEHDVANLLQAKAAIAAGILTLLERVQLTPAQIKTVYLAGGFGLHLRKESAIGCGLLPGFLPEQIEVVGNTSLAGAYLALLDSGALDEIARAGKHMEVVELNKDPGFEDRYIEQLSLP